MLKLCPVCGSVTAYNTYFGAYICGNCNWWKSDRDSEPFRDVVEVVRCKDCRFRFRNAGHSRAGCPITDTSVWMDDNDFCSFGELKTD